MGGNSTRLIGSCGGTGCLEGAISLQIKAPVNP